MQRRVDAVLDTPLVTASSSAATPRPCSTAAQRRRVAPSSSSSASPPAASPGTARATVLPRNGVSAASRIRIGRGCSSARSRTSHSRAAGVPNTLAVARHHGRHPDGGQRLAQDRALVVGPHEHGDVAGPQRRAVDRRRAREQGRDVRGDVPRDARCGRPG